MASTGGAEAGMSDDLPFARRVADHFGVPLEVVTIDPDRMSGDVSRMVAQLDEPLADPAALNVLYISEIARSAGMKVLLSGAGGDDLFTGYRRHAAANASRYWQWLPIGIRAQLEALAPHLDQRVPTLRRMAKLLDGISLTGADHVMNYFAWTRQTQVLSLFTEEARAAMRSEQRSAPMQKFLSAYPATLEPLEQMLLLEQRFFLADHNLLYTDKMSMAAGVEVRVPFLDLDLVQHAARIPIKWKHKGRVGKWVLKKAMEPYLPSEVIYRPKAGFGAPLRRWIRNDLRPLVHDILSADKLSRRGVFDPEAVERLIYDNELGKVDGAYTLFSLLTIEIWCQTFIDRRSKQQCDKPFASLAEH